MNRRIFIILSSFFSLNLFCKTSQIASRWSIIKDVQNHLFPKTDKFPSADEFKALDYLMFVSNDISMDEDDLKTIKKGAEVLRDRYGYLSKLSFDKKEKILREFEKEQFGQEWLSLIITYTLEALLSDPIYHGNKNMIGWKSFNHHSGEPRAKRAFGKENV